MQLFNRRVSVVGPPAETVAYLTDMQAFVSGKSGRDIGLWAGSFGAPQGTFVFSTAVEGLADLAAVTDQLASDPEYHEKLAAGAAYNGAPAEDTLSDVLHGEVGNRPPVGSVVSVTSVLIGNGAYSAAIGWGVEMAQFAASVSGIATNAAKRRYRRCFMVFSIHCWRLRSARWLPVSLEPRSCQPPLLLRGPEGAGKYQGMRLQY